MRIICGVSSSAIRSFASLSRIARGSPSRTAGELVRRVSGRTLGRFFAEEIAGPLGLEFFIGLPAKHEHRVSRIIEKKATDPGVLDNLPKGEVRELGKQYARAVADSQSLTVRAFSVGGFRDMQFNEPRYHAAELPWGNGIGDARSLAGSMRRASAKWTACGCCRSPSSGKPPASRASAATRC